MSGFMGSDFDFSGPVFSGVGFDSAESLGQPFAFGQSDFGQPYAFGQSGAHAFNQPDQSSPGLFGSTAAPAAPAADASSDASAPDLGDRINTWLNKNVFDLGGAGTAKPAGTGAGQSGAFADKLKTALTGMQNIAKAPDQPKDGQPGSAWPFGRPQAAAVAPTQSRGTAVAGLAQMIQLLQQRRQQYLQQGARMPSGAPGGGLLGM